MMYLVTQIAPFLLMALAVGILTGWLTCKPR